MADSKADPKSVMEFVKKNGVKILDLRFIPTSMTLVNIGERSIGQIW